MNHDNVIAECKRSQQDCVQNTRKYGGAQDSWAGWLWHICTEEKILDLNLERGVQINPMNLVRNTRFREGKSSTKAKHVW
jgi:hypothetical protein